MEILPIDVLFRFAIELDLPDLLGWCSTNRRNAEFCRKDKIWLYMLNLEYPNYQKLQFGLNPKKTYLLLKKIEKYDDLVISVFDGIVFLKQPMIDFLRSINNNDLEPLLNAGILTRPLLFKYIDKFFDEYQNFFKSASLRELLTNNKRYLHHIIEKAIYKNSELNDEQKEYRENFIVKKLASIVRVELTGEQEKYK